MEIIYNDIKNLSDIKDNLDTEINEFFDLFTPLESTLYLLQDNVTNAIFCECHILADKFVQYGTKDVPLDPEEQPEYRANRELVEDNIAFLQMKSDALQGRNFSNIVTEYTTDFDSEHPLKVIGGQHRFEAISEAFRTSSMNVYQGIKVYFCLDIEQRLDVQLISNTNIAVSSDLLDRMMETVKGPQLRNWCQEVGLLAPNSDFSDKKQRGNSITVREARTFILNYFNGKDLCNSPFEQTKTQCVLAKTGGIDNDWENLKITIPNLWNDTLLKEAGKQFALLAQKQNEFFTEDAKKTNKEFADKAYNYAILASWAYVAGILSNNSVRLIRHYNLPTNSKKDPLNAEALAKAKHKSDPVNYRGLGSRTDVKERGRLVELFYLQAEKGAGITKPLIDLALTKYFAKQANLEVLEAEKKIQ